MLPISAGMSLSPQKSVEMRFAPPENLKRVPGPRALLYSLPRDESVASRTRTTSPLQPKACVERFHRTYGQACLQVHQPSTLQEVREITEAFLQHYN